MHRSKNSYEPELFLLILSAIVSETTAFLKNKLL